VLRQWRCLLLIVLAPMLLASGCMATGAEPEFEMLDSTEIVVYYARGHSSAAKDVLAVLEENQQRIIEDLRPVKKGKYAVRIYPTLQAFHEAMGSPDAPSSIVGMAWSDSELRMVSPGNPGPSHDYESMLKVAVHELAHCVTARVAVEKEAPASVWLWESIALYEAGQARDVFALPSMQAGQVPRFLGLTQQDRSADIYQIGYTVADYLIRNWGWEGVRELVLASGDVTEVLGLTEDEFYAGWYEFVSKHLGN